MFVAEPLAQGWKAELALAFERRGDRTVLASRRHDGPLVVQRPLYPEGDAVCHAIVVHPPAGIAGGDELCIAAGAGPGAAALLTTPGAGKWYRSAGAWASQRLAFHLADGAALEWLPQETIVFDGARADVGLDVELSGDALFLGWDIVCFGRTGSGERFARGSYRTATRIRRDGRLLWFERGTVDGGGALLGSAVGLRGHSVCGTFIAAGRPVDLAAARQVEGLAVTQLPGVMVARCLGDSSEAVRRGFARLWALLRPALAGREAHVPRIWST